jgi:hypothetical protein
MRSCYDHERVKDRAAEILERLAEGSSPGRSVAASIAPCGSPNISRQFWARYRSPRKNCRRRPSKPERNVARPPWVRPASLMISSMVTPEYLTVGGLAYIAPKPQSSVTVRTSAEAWTCKHSLPTARSPPANFSLRAGGGRPGTALYVPVSKATCDQDCGLHERGRSPRRIRGAPRQSWLSRLPASDLLGYPLQHVAATQHVPNPGGRDCDHCGS